MLPLLVAALLSVAARVEAAGSFGFGAAPGSPFGVGTLPASVAIGDLNGDGKPDLVITNYGSDSLTVLVGDGNGDFAAALGSPFATGTDPISVAIGDLNGDAKPDLVCATAGSNDVTVLLGDGSGGFGAAPGSPFVVGTAPGSVAIGDLNGDTKPDLVSANINSNDVTVLLGDGFGGFGAVPGSPFAVGSFPVWVAIDDLNGDTKPDLATANRSSSNVTVLLGDGSGGFSAAPGGPFGAGPDTQSLAIGDLNGDAKPDLVTANQGSNDVTVLLGDGSGGFVVAPGSPFGTGKKPDSVAIGDVNGDAKPDVVTANESSDNVTALLGDGSGAFGAARPFGVGSVPVCAVIGDLNGDTKLDTVSANAGSDDVTVLLNTTSFAPLITGKQMRFRDDVDPVRRQVRILSKDAAIDLGDGNGSNDDPTIVGLTVRVESASAGLDDTYTLPAGGWSVVGEAGQNKGYKYKDSELMFGPIKTARLRPGPAAGRPGQIRFNGNGSGLPGLATSPAPVNVEVIAGGLLYCMTFGGTTEFTVNRSFRSTDAPASPGCPP